MIKCTLNTINDTYQHQCSFSVHQLWYLVYSILRHMLGYTNDQQLHLMTPDIQVHLLISWHEFVQYLL